MSGFLRKEAWEMEVRRNRSAFRVSARSTTLLEVNGMRRWDLKNSLIGLIVHWEKLVPSFVLWQEYYQD